MCGRIAAALIVALTLLAQAPTARAQAATQFSLPAQPLESALRAVGTQTNTNIFFDPALVSGRQAPALDAQMTVDEALARLLAGTGLQHEFLSEHTVAIRARDSKTEVDREQAGPSGKDQESSAATEARPTGHGERIEEIVVTAQKRAERILDVPMSISAFDKKSIEDAGAVQLADFLESAPGVGIIDGQGGTQSIQIRGINSTFGAAPVGYYLDELPFSFAASVQLPDVRTYDLERVEVLRGPQGTLYGDGSLGGTIRILTKEPDLRAWQADVDLSGAGTVDGDGSHAAKGVVNLPVKEDVIGLRLVASKEEFGGWVDNTLTGVKDQNDRDVENYRAKVRIAPSTKLDLVLSAWRTQEYSLEGAISLADRTANVLPTARAMDYELYSAIVRYRFPAFDLLSATSKMTLSQSSLGAFLGLPQSGDQTNEVLAEELRLTSNTDGRFRWTSGVFYRRYEQDSHSVYQALNAVFDQFSKSNSYAAFGEGTWSVLDRRLDLTLGLRYFKDDRLRKEPVDPSTLALIHILDPSFTGAVEESFDTINPRLNLAFRANEDWLIYANVAKGFRTGQVQPVISLVLAALNGVAIPVGINEETLWSYEVGMKGMLADGRMQLDSALFYNDWRDLQINVVLDPVSRTSGLINGGRARSVGIELGATFLPLDGLTLRLAGSHLNAEYAEDLAGTAIRKGDRINQVPETTLSATATYRWPLTSGLRGFARGNAQFTSDRVDVVNGALPSDAMTILDLRVGMEGKAWGAYLFADNVTDQAGAIDITLRGSATAVRPRPRTYGLNVRFSFH